MNAHARQKLGRLLVALAAAGMLAGCATKDGSVMYSFWGDQVAPKDLPAPVAKTIKERFPGSTIYSVERENFAGATTYEVRIRDRDGRYELRVGEDGLLRAADWQGM
jgi:hypothetical protein